MKQKTVEQDINSFLDIWDCSQMIAFLREIIPLFSLYNVDNEDDWVKKEVGEENQLAVCIARTVYQVSRIADFHAGKLLMIKTKYPRLWERIEKQSKEEDYEPHQLIR